MKNVFVVGLERFNLALLEALPDANQYRFHELLGYSEAVHPTSGIDLDRLLEISEAGLAAFSGTIDAIIGYWDFPSSVIVPVLGRRHGLPGPRLEAVAACEHKYWCRLEQQRVIPDLVPRFCAFDPFAEDPFSSINLAFPFWIKPVKAHSSYLGFKIHDKADFEEALPVIRANIDRFGKPFDRFLSMVDRPEEIASIGGHYCIAEEIISAGDQCTLEGYVHDGNVVVYGVVDSIRSGRHRSSFSRYQYPSNLPQPVRYRMIAATKTFMTHIGYDNAPFNVEYYWNAETDAISILEVNTRISKSHSPLFMMVDGASHQKVAIELALGQKPDFPQGCGAFPIAAKFMLRIFEDGIVEQVPGDDDIARLQSLFPEALVRILVKQGARLAHLPYQDSYSYELAEVFLGANSEEELSKKYDTALSLLPFKLKPLEAE